MHSSIPLPLIGNLGNESLAILYISVCVFVFTAPAIVARIGEKWAMVLGALGYVIYMASVIYVIDQIVIATSVIIGKTGYVELICRLDMFWYFVIEGCHVLVE